ncbi:S8 family serine peptidase [Leucobacter sp.]
MVGRRPWALLGAGFVALGIVLGAALPAHAVLDSEQRESGLWYAERLKFDEIRAQGLSGKGITIAVVDDAINLDAPELEGADIEVRGQFCRNRETGEELPATTDDSERAHGTNVVAMLVGNGTAADGGLGTRGIVPDAKILFYAADGTPASNGEWDCEAYNPVAQEYERDLAATANGSASYDEAEASISFPPALAARQAIEDGADIVSVSSVSSVWNGMSWYPVGIQAMRAGVPLVAGTLNPDAGVDDVLELMPGVMNGTVGVGGVDNEGNVIRGVDGSSGLEQETRGLRNLAFAGPAYQMLTPSGDGAWQPGYGSGTSLATPLVAGTIALGMERYPEATAFQVLQSMVRTTGNGEVTEPEWVSEQYGYGIINPSAMLELDPGQFPDENPLFVMSGDDPRCGAGAPSEATASLESCLWSAGPSADDVWPQSGETDSGAERSTPGGAPSAAPVFWILGGVLLLGVLAAGIVIPVVLVRSRRSRPAPHPVETNWTEGSR